jgi:HEAT repeat protein
VTSGKDGSLRAARDQQEVSELPPDFGSALRTLGASRADEFGNGNIRCGAALALGSIGASAVTEPVLDALLAGLVDGYAGREAASALGSLGVQAATDTVLNGLAGLLIAGHARLDANEVLKRLGPRTTVDDFLNSMRELTIHRAHFSPNAHEVLRRLKPDASDDYIRYSQIRGGEEGESWVRQIAATVLGRLGPAAATERVLAALLQVLLRDEEVMLEVLEALGGLGPAAATEPIVRAVVFRLRSRNEFVRASAAKTLGSFGNRHTLQSLVVRALLARLEDGSRHVRETVAWSLGTFQNSGTPLGSARFSLKRSLKLYRILSRLDEKKEDLREKLASRYPGIARKI